MTILEGKTELSACLRLKDRELIALTGAGGKTSTMLRLARELSKKGRRPVCSTTTKVWHREVEKDFSLIMPEGIARLREKINSCLGEGKIPFLGKGILESGKISGIDPQLCDSIFAQGLSDILVLEADGARGLPVKAPAVHEPVVPSTTTLLIAIIGLEILGAAFSADLVFRPDLFAGITGITEGDLIDSRVLADLILSPKGSFKGAPPQARKTVFLNKLDLIGSREDAAILANEILCRGEGLIDRVIVGSLKNDCFFLAGEKR